MSTPTVTHKSLRNEGTGIDVCVPRLREEEAPLGGLSVLYEVSVLTRCNLFKNRLHKNEDVVQFTILKAYRELEDLHSKLSKKYPNASFPSIPKSSSEDKSKVIALDQFMKVVAMNVEVCYSEIFRQFIGVNSRRTSISSITAADVDKDEHSAEGTNELFPKMKNVASERNESTATEKVPSLDLFEEEKLGVKEKPSGLSKCLSPTGLFDEFEDDSLFKIKTPEKKQLVKAKEVSPPAKKPEPVKRQEKTVDEKVDDSEIIINDRKFGDVLMFNEQDLGEYVTKDEEDLFLVSSPSEDSKKNPLLSPGKEILSPETDDSVSESLDDLLKMEPLPSSPAISKKESTETKPVPLPRKKSLGKVETDGLQRPEVKPRKVFLSKTYDATKPAIKPALPPKPVQSKPPPPPKPKPALKPSMKNRNLDANSENQNSVPEQKADFKELDILKYIEQEQKTFDSELSLFD